MLVLWKLHKEALESTLQRNHDDHIAEKGLDFFVQIVHSSSNAPNDENFGCESCSG